MVSKKTALGKGLGALIPQELDVTIFDEDKHRVQKLLISEVTPNPDQPRHETDEISLSELTASVKQHGILQPIIVVRHGKSYRIVAGERRWRAAEAAKLTHIPVIVRSLKELEQVELALIENIQRVDLSPIDQARAVYKLQHQFSLSLEKIAEKLGKAPSTLSNLARLLQLPEPARQALSQGRISEGHARAILGLKNDPTKQNQLLTSILDNAWTVRQAEQFVVAAKSGASTAKAASRTISETPLTRQISQKIGLPVRIKHTAKGGQLIVQFADEDELSELARKLHNLDS